MELNNLKNTNQDEENKLPYDKEAVMRRIETLLKFDDLGIEEVKFCEPFITVKWSDGLKSVIAGVSDDITGLALAISEKALGKGFQKVFEKHTTMKERGKMLIVTHLSDDD